MLKDWITVSCPGLAIIFLIGLAGAQNQSVETAGSEQEVRTRLSKIQQSFEKQRAMFRNMRFKANWLDPHVQIKQDPGKPPDQVEIIEIPDEKILNLLEYQTDKDGRYLMSLEQHVTDAATGKIKSKSHSSKYGFNGETYRAFYSEKQASIFTPEQKFSTGQSLIKPTSFMDHMFDEDLNYVFVHPERAELSETSDGLWILKYEDAKSQYKYQATLDPKQDFMIVELERTSKEGHVYIKKTEYKSTSEGFWCPVKGYRSFGGKHELTMNVTELELNVADVNYTLEFPKGTHVRDYTRRADPPEAYRYGQKKKSCEQIVSSGGKFVAGVAIDETGLPVAGVPVQVCGHKKSRGDGRFSLTFSGSFDVLNAVTDEQGRFAIELEEDGEYNLLFSPKNHAAIIAYDVPVGKSDLKVVLSEGGTVAGRLLRIEDENKVPIPSAEVKIEQSDRSSYSHLGFDRNQKTATDSQGRFRFDHLRTKMRDFRTSKSEQWEYTPRVWEISYGTTSKTIAFYEGTKIEDLELVVEPDYTNPASLVGKPLPDFENITIEFEPRQAWDKILLICFFDMNQRPSRNCMKQLGKKAQKLKEKEVVVVTIHASKIEKEKLDDWIKENDINLTVGMIKGDVEKTKFTWGVRSLPWLILTDRQHNVTAEGFGIDELERKIEEIGTSVKTPADSNEVVGLVRDPQGRPLSGVRVTEFQTDKDYTTDAEGKFISAYSPSDERRFFFAVDKQRKLVGSGELPPEREYVEIKLTPGRVISGTVVDPTGKPVAGAQVAPLPMTCFHVLTDDRGRFDVAWSPSWEPREGLCLMARNVGLNLAALVEIDDDIEIVQIKLTPALTLAGTVEDTDGNPIAGAKTSLSLIRGWGCGTPVKEVITNEQGRFELSCLPQRQEYGVQAKAEGFWRNQITTGIINRTIDQEEIGPIILKRPILTVSGIVVYANGKSVADIPVYLHGEGQPDPRSKTDADGRFVFEKVCCGPIQINAKNDSFFGKIETEGGAKDVKVVVRPRFE